MALVAGLAESGDEMKQGSGDRLRGYVTLLFYGKLR